MAEEDGRHPGGAPSSVDPTVDHEPTAAEFEGLGGETNPEILPRGEPWRSIVHVIGIIEQVIGAILLAAILFLVIALVAQRYLPGANYPWTGEVARLSMVWGTFVMAGYLAAHDRHIAIHVVDYVIGGRSLAAIKLIVNVIVMVTCLVLLYATYQLIADDIGQVTAAAQIPLRFVNAVPIIGFALTALRAGLWIVVDDIPALMGRREQAA
jgi:TRAP-type C4-dicarboxylate transport system permease small subunit